MIMNRLLYHVIVTVFCACPTAGFGIWSFFPRGVKKSKIVPVKVQDGFGTETAVAASHAYNEIHETSGTSEPDFIPRTQFELNRVLLDQTRDLIDQFGNFRQRIDPRLHMMKCEHIPSQLPFGVDQIRFAAMPLGQSATSTVHLIKPEGSWVIKFSAFCRDRNEILDPIEPILVESWFLEQLMYLDPGLAPKFLYYSAGSRNQAITKEFPTESGRTCYPQDSLSDDGNVSIFTSRSNFPTVRYLITERFGVSAWKYWANYRERRMDFFEAIRIGGQMIQLLE